ncbi:MAG: adenylosuccinate lyase [Deltaproteobacteria bacterium]|nr:adenylosuccinate lyase [Deltaproteobacteria bacterium]
MIERYTRPVMAAIWEAQNRYSKWLKVEVLVCEALAMMGEIPAGAVENIRSRARFDAARIEEIERTIRHDVIAFLTDVAESVGPDSRYIHLGLTSSDILDTTFALQLREASDVILEDLRRLLSILKKTALRHKNTVMMGRTHGVHAEPVTFGLKMALWHEETRRNIRRMEMARETISTGKISGAVGTFSYLAPEVEHYVCRKLGLKPASVSSQIIQRDRHAEFFCALAMVATSVEKFALEIRHLQRTEVLEAEEFFHAGQKGSSAMPHKRNPILSENLCGLARLVRSYAMAAMENVPLWHERDISHSSVERVIGPDSTILVDYMLNRFCGILENLMIYPDRMRENMERTQGLFYSEGVLLALARKGLTREEAYALVQRNAMKAWEEGADFRSLIENDADIAKTLNKEEIAKIFNLEHHLSHVDHIFARVFGPKAKEEQ